MTYEEMKTALLERSEILEDKIGCTHIEYHVENGMDCIYVPSSSTTKSQFFKGEPAECFVKLDAWIASLKSKEQRIENDLRKDFEALIEKAKDAQGDPALIAIKRIEKKMEKLSETIDRRFEAKQMNAWKHPPRKRQRRPIWPALIIIAAASLVALSFS